MKIEDLVLKTPDYAGDVWFSADVRNTLPQVAKIRLQAKAYSSSGELLDSKTFFPDPIDLPAFGHGTFSTYVSAKGKEISRVVVVPINR